MEGKKVFVLDTSAMIAGFNPNLEDAEQYIVPKVLEEARSMSVKLKIEMAIKSGQIKVREPSENAMEKVKETIEKTKDRVSLTDRQLLGLAYELKDSDKDPEIITDDYAIQNLAELMDISYSQVAKPGITDLYKWKKVCPACERTYEEDISKCEACGSKLQWKPEG
ncbi:MAG: NOB1 family endonuclease [Candidatus Aenigmatarchaeota archaeon]